MTHRCEEHDKVLYESIHSAKKAIAFCHQNKDMRAYECSNHHGRFHLTKQWLHKRNDNKRKTLIRN